MDDPIAALVDQHAELAGILARLGEEDWRRPTRCDGWDVADVVLHLAQSDELAVAAVKGTFEETVDRLTRGAAPAASVDEAVAGMVDAERLLDAGAIHQRWRATADQLAAALQGDDPSRRVPWVTGVLSIRTLATTRVAETWIHAGDVATAVGESLEPTDRLRLVARLAWRTLPYAFAKEGRTLHGPVAFRLTAPDGTLWDFDGDAPAVTVITGPAADLCAVAARRTTPEHTALVGDGPDAGAVLELVRTYA